MNIWRSDFLTNFDINKQILFYAGGSQFPYLDWAYPDKKMIGDWKYDDIQKWCYLEDILKLAVERDLD